MTSCSHKIVPLKKSVITARVLDIFLKKDLLFSLFDVLKTIRKFCITKNCKL